MAGIVHQPRPKPGDSEKITINLGYVDLGHIDLLVAESSTRTAPTSSEPPSATSLSVMPRRPGNRWPARPSILACGTSRARTWRRSARRGRRSRSTCWVSPA